MYKDIINNILTKSTVLKEKISFEMNSINDRYKELINKKKDIDKEIEDLTTKYRYFEGIIEGINSTISDDDKEQLLQYIELYQTTTAISSNKDN